ncbi:MAG: hypothetical protein EOO24_01680 [Comamonadaceae bacterium]|nr:MAG: hypothetical protein EOO24_01680 [Comamonadaceae bacterium]
MVGTPQRQVLRNLTPEQRQAARQLVTLIKKEVDPGRTEASTEIGHGGARRRSAALHPETQKDIDRIVQGLQDAIDVPVGGGPAAVPQRRLAAIDFLGRVLRNDFEGDFGRNAANVVNIALRTGLVVTIATFVRDAISLEIGRAKGLGESQTAIEALGIACIALAPLLNVVGGLRDGLRGTGTQTSALSRILLSTTHTVLVTTCHFLGSFSAVRDSAITMTAYSMLRDLLNFVAPLKDNLSSLPWLALGISTLIYASMQVIVGTAIDVAAPMAGAGGLPPIGPDGDLTALAAANLVIGHTLLKANLNAFIEVCDDLTVLYIARAIEVRRYRTKTERSRTQEEAYVLRERRLISFANGLLDARREDRAKKIAKENKKLYMLEIERLNGLELRAGSEAELIRSRLEQSRGDFKASKLAQKETDANWAAREQAGFGRSSEPPRLALPLMETIRRGKDAVVPDFELLDIQIRDALAVKMPDASEEDRDELMRELYIDAVVRTMMPVPESALQKKIRDEVLRDGSLSPLAVRVRVNKMVKDQRDARMAPLRVSVRGVWEMHRDSLAQDATRQALTTDSARVNAFQALLALLVLMAPVVNQLEDGILKSFLTSALVGIAMLPLYPALYKSHDARAPRQRLELPGGTGAREVPPEELDEETELNHGLADTMAEAEDSGGVSDPVPRGRGPATPRADATVRFGPRSQGPSSVPRRPRQSASRKTDVSHDSANASHSAANHDLELRPRPTRTGEAGTERTSNAVAGPSTPGRSWGNSGQPSRSGSWSVTASGTTRRAEPEALGSPSSDSTPTTSPLMARRLQKAHVADLPERSKVPPASSSTPTWSASRSASDASAASPLSESSSSAFHSALESSGPRNPSTQVADPS